MMSSTQIERPAATNDRTQSAKLKRRFLDIEQVFEITSLSRSTLYKEISAGRFPRPVPVSPGRKAWVESEVEAWIDSRIEARG